MRVPLLFLLLFCMATPLLGADTTRRYVPQYDESVRSDCVRAATSNAVRNLYDESAASNWPTISLSALISAR